jgi:hypothetical protein
MQYDFRESFSINYGRQSSSPRNPNPMAATVWFVNGGDDPYRHSPAKAGILDTMMYLQNFSSPFME